MVDVAVAGRGLEKSYVQGGESVNVLGGVDITVGRGEFVSVMGPSGSGKSTLLHLLGGLDVPDAGEVVLDGRPLSEMGDDERTRLRADHVGIVYQFFNLVPVLTAAENVALPAVIAGQHPSAYRSRTDDLLDLVGLAGHGDKLPSQLSGGQQQRVAVARALFAEPAVVLADEPTGNLDVETGAEILDLLGRARRELGQSLLLVTHDPRSAAHGDRVMLLRGGVVADQLTFGPSAGTGDDLVTRTEAVLDLFGGRRHHQEPSVATVNGASRSGATADRRARRRAPLRAAEEPTP